MHSVLNINITLLPLIKFCLRQYHLVVCHEFSYKYVKSRVYSICSPPIHSDALSRVLDTTLTPYSGNFVIKKMSACLGILSRP